MSNSDNTFKSIILEDLKTKRKKEAKQFIELLHKENDRYLTIVRKNKSKEWINKAILYKEVDSYLDANLNKTEDHYVSMNGFYNYRRTEQSVRHLNALWVDLDYYKIDKYKDKSISDMIKIMKNDGLFNELEPSFFVNSGNGIYIIWLIKNAPKAVLKMWKCCMDKLYKKFENYGADPMAKDVSRVLRLPGSSNSKTNKDAYLYLYKKDTKRYTLKDIGDILLKPLVAKKKEAVSPFIKTPHFHNKRCFRILKDLEKLVKIRAGECRGFREVMCFVYHNFAQMIYTEDDALKKTESFNFMFSSPLSEKELNMVHRQSKIYKYSNQKLVDLFDISIEEQYVLKELRSKELVKKERRLYQKDWQRAYRHKFKTISKRKEAKDNKINSIKRLLVLGNKQKDIAEKLSINKSTVSKYIKAYLLDLDIQKEKMNMLMECISKPEDIFYLFEIENSNISQLLKQWFLQNSKYITKKCTHKLLATEKE